MKPLSVFALAVLVVLGGVGVRAETVQQERRIEEEKREELRPTVETGQDPALVQPPAPPVALPAPPPIAPLYFATLAQKRVVFRYDAVKALVILLGVDEQHISLDAQLAYLKAQGLLPTRFERKGFDASRPLRKGEAAYMFRQALRIPGGLALRLFGPSERYAMKELEFQGIMAPGHVRDLVSGVELVQIMDSSAKYQLKQTASRRP